MDNCVFVGVLELFALGAVDVRSDRPKTQATGLVAIGQILLVWAGVDGDVRGDCGVRGIHGGLPRRAIHRFADKVDDTNRNHRQKHRTLGHLPAHPRIDRRSRPRTDTVSQVFGMT